jgi:hypothetical protein
MGSIFGGGAQQNNANQDQSAINQTVQNQNAALAQVSPFIGQALSGLLGIGKNAGNSIAGQQQGQIQSLSNTFNNANTSSLNTEKQQLGGVANPSLLLRDQSTQNAQSGMQNTQNLQSGLAGQDLSAMGLQQSSYGDIGSIFSSILGGNSSLMSGLNTNQANNQQQANQTQNSNAGMFGSLLGGLGGLFG